MKRLALGLLLTGLLAWAAHAQSIPAVTTNHSATIATGGTFQVVLSALAAGSQRRSLTIQNNNTSADNCYIAFGVGITAGNATKAESQLLKPGGSLGRYLPYVPSDEIEATCDSSNDTLYIDTQ